MKLVFLLFSISFLSHNSFSQDVKFDWVKSIGDTLNDSGYSVVLDEQENSYYTGIFQGMIDADPGAGFTPLISNGFYDVFVIKLDVNGNLIWAKSFGADLWDLAESITYFNNYIYLTGFFMDTVDFDLGSGIDYQSSSGIHDFFVVKLDIQGNTIWTKTFGSTQIDSGSDIVVDNNNNLYISGYFQDTVDFDPGIGLYEVYSSAAAAAFLLKLNEMGGFEWVNTIKGTNSVTANSVCLDEFGNVYFGGEFFGDADFNPSSLIELISSNGSRDFFVQKYDTNGTYYWTKTLGGTNIDNLGSIYSDPSGNIILGGSFQGNFDSDPGYLINNLFTNGSSDYNAFIIKLDSTGSFLWSKSFGDSGYDGVIDLKTDFNGNVYSIGSFSGTVNFESIQNPYILTSNGVTDIFLLKIDSLGNHNWALRIGGDSVNLAQSFDLDNLGNLFITGTFSSDVDFDWSISEALLSSNGGRDVFFLKLSQCYFNDIGLVNSQLDSIYSHCPLDSITPPLAINNCGSLIEGSTNNVFPITQGITEIEWAFYNGNGNDTIYQFQIVEVDLINDSISFNGQFVFSNTSGFEYQWFDCFTGQPLVGETSSYYIPNTNGSYFLKIGNDSCFINTNCLTIQDLSSKSLDKNIVHVYPNPSTNFFNIEFGNLVNVSIVVYSSLGSIIFEDNNINSLEYRFKLDESPGVYFIEIIQQNTKTRLKLILK